MLLVCENCGEGFESDDGAFNATCPNCETRYQPRTGCC